MVCLDEPMQGWMGHFQAGQRTLRGMSTSLRTEDLHGVTRRATRAADALSAMPLSG